MAHPTNKMMATDPDRKDKTNQRRALPMIDSAADEGEACSTCRSNDWIWDEEVQFVRAMNGIKQQVRAARARGDEQTVRALRNEFVQMRRKMEEVRRKRLDSLGHYDYD